MGSLFGPSLLLPLLLASTRAGLSAHVPVCTRGRGREAGGHAGERPGMPALFKTKLSVWTLEVRCHGPAQVVGGAHEQVPSPRVVGG